MFENENSKDIFQTFRIGVVSSIDEKKCTAKVYFEDRDDSVSHDLRIIVPQTMNTKCYWMPDINEQVICLFLQNGEETGFILGSFYSDVDRPPPDISEEGKTRKGIWIDGYNYVKWVEEKREFLIRTEKPIRFVVDPPWPEWGDDY